MATLVAMGAETVETDEIVGEPEGVGTLAVFIGTGRDGLEHNQSQCYPAGDSGWPA
jgi:hypothetical protein